MSRTPRSNSNTQQRQQARNASLLDDELDFTPAHELRNRQIKNRQQPVEGRVASAPRDNQTVRNVQDDDDDGDDGAFGGNNGASDFDNFGDVSVDGEGNNNMEAANEDWFSELGELDQQTAEFTRLLFAKVNKQKSKLYQEKATSRARGAASDLSGSVSTPPSNCTEELVDEFGVKLPEIPGAARAEWFPTRDAYPPQQLPLPDTKNCEDWWLCPGYRKHTDGVTKVRCNLMCLAHAAYTDVLFPNLGNPQLRLLRYQQVAVWDVMHFHPFCQVKVAAPPPPPQQQPPPPPQQQQQPAQQQQPPPPQQQQQPQQQPPQNAATTPAKAETVCCENLLWTQTPKWSNGRLHFNCTKCHQTYVPGNSNTFLHGQHVHRGEGVLILMAFIAGERVDQIAKKMKSRTTDTNRNNDNAARKANRNAINGVLNVAISIMEQQNKLESKGFTHFVTLDESTGSENAQFQMDETPFIGRVKQFASALEASARKGGPLWAAGGIIFNHHLHKVSWATAELLVKKGNEGSLLFSGRKRKLIFDVTEHLVGYKGTCVADCLNVYDNFGERAGAVLYRLDHSKKQWRTHTGHSTSPLEGVWGVFKRSIRQRWGRLGVESIVACGLRLSFAVWLFNRNVEFFNGVQLNRFNVIVGGTPNPVVAAFRLLHLYPRVQMILDSDVNKEMTAYKQKLVSALAEKTKNDKAYAKTLEDIATMNKLRLAVNAREQKHNANKPRTERVVGSLAAHQFGKLDVDVASPMLPQSARAVSHQTVSQPRSGGGRFGEKTSSHGAVRRSRGFTQEEFDSAVEAKVEATVEAKLRAYGLIPTTAAVVTPTPAAAAVSSTTTVPATNKKTVGFAATTALVQLQQDTAVQVPAVVVPVVVAESADLRAKREYKNRLERTLSQTDQTTELFRTLQGEIRLVNTQIDDLLKFTRRADGGNFHTSQTASQVELNPLIRKPLSQPQQSHDMNSAAAAVNQQQPIDAPVQPAQQQPKPQPKQQRRQAPPENAGDKQFLVFDLKDDLVVIRLNVVASQPLSQPYPTDRCIICTKTAEEHVPKVAVASKTELPEKARHNFKCDSVYCTDSEGWIMTPCPTDTRQRAELQKCVESKSILLCATCVKRNYKKFCEQRRNKDAPAAAS
jgi:hypothetical protein